MDHPRRGRGRRRRLWIDVKTISCRGVKSFVPFQKPALYALLSLVRVPSDPKNHSRRHEHDEDDDDDDDDDHQQQQQQQKQRTPVDLDGGENPEWDHPMRLSFSSPRADRLPLLLLRFDVAAHNIPLLGDKVLAAAQVPVAHLLNAAAEESPGAARAGALRHLSYELRAPDATKPNGVLTFSFRISTPLSAGGGITSDHVDPGINVGAPISACAPQYSPPPPPPPPPPPTNVFLYPPLDPAPYYPPPEIYPPPPPPLFPDPEPLYPPPGTRFPFQGHDLELYPPPSTSAPVACYPPQDPGYCHATPRRTYGRPTDNEWDRRSFYGGSN